MADFTQNYGLHQWEPTDPFLREDFNQDFSTIDTALGRAERSAEANAYNVYNLMLQNYYEGKYTGYKKALLFDGFLDESGIQALIPGAWHNSEEHRVEIALTGAQDYATSFKLNPGDTAPAANDADRCFWLGAWNEYSVTTEFTPDGFGDLQAVTLRMAWYTTDVPILVNAEILDGDQVLGTSQSVSVSSYTFADYRLTFPERVFLSAHKLYTLRINNVDHAIYARVVKRNDTSGEIAAMYHYSQVDYTSGQLLSVPVTLEAEPQRVLAWARYQRGTLDFSLAAEGGTTPFTAGTVHPAETLDGIACLEQAFVLDLPPACAAGAAVQIGLTAGEEGCWLHDYGVVFL